MTRFTAKVLGDDARDRWQALWERSPRRLAQHWDYLDAVATGVGRPVRVGVMSVSGDLVAGLSFVERRHRFLTAWRHPSPAASCGLLAVDDPPGESALRDLLGAAAECIAARVAAAEVIFQPTVQDVRGLLWRGWEARPHYNYVSPVSAPDSLASAAENAVRRQARKAEEAGVAVALGADDLLPALEPLAEATRRRNGVPAWVTPEGFRALLRWLSGPDAPTGFSACVAVARDAGGAPQGGAMLALDGARAYYLLGGSANADEGSQGAPTLLHFAASEALLQRRGGTPYLYDWVGANTPSVAQFKKKFRPELEVCHRVLWRSRLARLAARF